MTNDLSYSPGHPWFYVLGGLIPAPKAIRAAVQKSGYRGYLEADITAIDSAAEPTRSHRLRALRQQVARDMARDFARYRIVARALKQYRLNAKPPADRPICADIHTAASLKYNHLYNGFAHLVWLEQLLTVQPDLFG
jgi:hypothetical protein